MVRNNGVDRESVLVPWAAQEAQPEPSRESPSIPWWFVGLAMLILWGPLAGGLLRPYRPERR